MNMFYVYKHISTLTNEVIYVGKGKGNRAFEKKSRNQYWKNLTNLQGYRVEFVAVNLAEKDALLLEKEYILKLKPKCNLTLGGQGTAGYKFDPELVRLRNLANKNRFKDELWVEKRNKALKEAMSRPETKEKVKQFQELKKTQIKLGLRSIKSRTKWTEAQKKQASESQKGEKGYWYGKITSVAKPVSNLTTGEVFVSLKAAAESVGGKYRGLAKAIKAGRKFKGQSFKLKD